jgi:hypothetical protein
VDCRFYSRGREGDKNMGGVSNKCSTYTTDLKLEEVIAGFGCLKFGSDTMYFTLVRVAVNRKCTASRTGKFT